MTLKNATLHWSHEKQILIFNRQVCSIHSQSYCFVTVLKGLTFLDPSHQTTINKLKLSSDCKTGDLFPKNPNFLPGSSNIKSGTSAFKQRALALMNCKTFTLVKEVQYHVNFT